MTLMRVLNDSSGSGLGGAELAREKDVLKNFDDTELCQNHPTNRHIKFEMNDREFESRR